MGQEELRRAGEAIRAALPAALRGTSAARHLDAMIPAWVAGVITQLHSFPEDIAIERAIHGSYPGLRAVQRRSLLAGAREARQALLPRVQALTPEPVFLTSNALNFALLSVEAELLQQPGLTRPYAGTSVERIGRELLALYDRRTTPLRLADYREISDEWATLLGLEGWYRWVPVAEIGPGPRRLWQ